MLDASGSQWRCPTALAIQQWVTLLRSVILSSRRVRLEAFHTWAGFARDAAVPKLSELMKKKARETETSDMPVGPPPVGGQVSRFGDEFERVCSQAQSAGKVHAVSYKLQKAKNHRRLDRGRLGRQAPSPRITAPGGTG